MHTIENDTNQPITHYLKIDKTETSLNITGKREANHVNLF